MAERLVNRQKEAEEGAANGDATDQPYAKWKASAADVRVNVTMEKSRCGPFPVMSRKMAIMVAGLLCLGLVLGFIIGYLIAFGVHGKPDSSDPSKPGYPFTKAFSEDIYQQVVDGITNEDIRARIEDFERNPTMPGSNQSATEAYRIQAQWTQYKYASVVNQREVLVPDAHTISMTEIKYDGSSMDVDTTKASPVSYSRSGTIMGPLLFANRGATGDLQQVAGAVNGSICIIRYGTEDLGVVMDRISMYGGLGVIVYTSQDDFPNVEQRSALVLNGKRLMGDPLTPALGVQPAGTYQLPTDEVLTKIPAFVLSYSTVLSISNSVTGSKPPGWEFSPGKTNSTFSVTLDYTYRKSNISSAFGSIRGAPDTERFVFVGTHHDQINPGADPATGRAIHNTVLHTLSEAAKNGIWKPRRSVVFASFDGSTLGIGAREWLEENRIQFEERGVAYFNLARSVTGSTFYGKASSIIESVIPFAAADAGIGNNVQSQPLDGTGDYDAFTDYLGIPSIEMQYLDENHPDEFRSVGSTTLPNGDTWITHLVKAQISAIMRFADAAILPYSLGNVSDTLTRGATAVSNFSDAQPFPGLEVQVQGLLNQITRLKMWITRFEGKRAEVNVEKLTDIKLRVINDILRAVPIVFLHPVGIPMVQDGKVIPNLNNRNMLRGRLSSNRYVVEDFPGVKDLFMSLNTATPTEAPQIQRAIRTHLSELNAAADLASDYLFRAVFDTNLFVEE